MAERPDLVVGTFNLHGEVDGWGRRFDALAGCAALNADVLVLQETWTPRGAPGSAQRIGAAMGYTVLTEILGTGRRANPHPRASTRWMRPLAWRSSSHALFLDGERSLPHRVTGKARFQEAEPGALGLAVLTRLPVTETAVIDLGRLGRDRVRRAALITRLVLGANPLTVVGTHMSHLTYGSPVQFGRLRRALREVLGPEAGVLVGDMNLWGPVVEAMLPGWHRTVRARTWPAWRPNSQLDHILVHGPIETVAGQALAPYGSDHRPVWVRLALR